MTRRLELTGQTFGHLRVERLTGSDAAGKSVWQCLCTCGKRTEVRSTSLKRGLTKSCGCAQNPTKDRFCETPGCTRKHAAKGFCAKHYTEAHAGHLKDLYLRKTFGISLRDYVAQFEAQDGVCAICKNPETDLRNGKIPLLAVDHLPGTNYLRALLCRKCNTALGLMRESSALLRAMADYLDLHTNAFSSGKEVA